MAARIALDHRETNAWPVDSIHLSTDALAQQHAHPRDSTIRFDEAKHLYYLFDSEHALPISVTGVINALFKHKESSFFLEAMSADSRAAKYGDMTDAQILTIWKAKGKDSALRGTRMHAAIEVFWNTYDPVLQWGYLSRDSVLEIEMAQFRAFVEHDFLRKHSLEPWRTEMLVHNDDWLAGSIDMIARSTLTGDFFILDWKRVDNLTADSNKPSKYKEYSDLLPELKLEDTKLGHYSVQLHLYRFLLMQHYMFPYIPATNLYLVAIHPNQVSYKLIQCYDYSHAVPKILAKKSEILARHLGARQSN